VPIRIDKFGSGGSSDPRRLISDFLRSNSSYAYTLDELIEALASKGISLRAEEVQNALDSLAAWGWVKSKIVEGVKYYNCKIIGFRPAR